MVGLDIFERNVNGLIAMFTDPLPSPAGCLGKCPALFRILSVEISGDIDTIFRKVISMLREIDYVTWLDTCISSFSL